MPAPYNLSTGSSNLFEMIIDINTATNGMFSIGFLILIFAILFFAMKNYPMQQAMAASSFITTVVAIFMFVGGFVSFKWLSVLIIITGISGIILMLTKN